MLGGDRVAVASRWGDGRGAIRAVLRDMVPRPGEADWAGDVRTELACIARDTLARTTHAALFGRGTWSGSHQDQSVRGVGQSGFNTSVTPFLATTCGLCRPAATP